jgi:cytochrome c-type protein NapB
MRNALPLVLAALASACATAPSAPPAAPAAGIPDADLGLSKVSVFAVPAPPAAKPNDTVPGELPVLPRAYALAPPRIPHGIDGFLPITPKQNSCVDCHAVKEKKAGEPTPIPASHYVDLRNAPGKAGDQVAGARWVCISCHVPRTDAQPLVESRFVARP